MADANRLFAPLRDKRSDVLERLDLEPGTYVVATIHRDANVVAPRLERILDGLRRIALPVVFPAHPRTRVAITTQGLSPGQVRLVSPLSYLDFMALASQARVIVTDSGGVQKEAYWYGVPCVTARPSTEWVDTVELGANTLVDDDPEATRRSRRSSASPARGPPRAVRRRPCSRSDRGGALYAFRPMTEPSTEARAAEPATQTWDVAVVGAGYVGVPLAQLLAGAGKSVLLVDIAEGIVAALNRGESHIEDVASETLRPFVEDGRISATTDYDRLRDADAIVVCLPTPLSKQREPDITILRNAVSAIATRLRPGHLVVLESTTYPGTTREIVLPLLETSGLEVGKDFNLAFSPERVDPGNTKWRPENVPKIVGGITEACTERAAALYQGAIDQVHPVSSPEAAELTKLLENIFRSVNIALVNELAQLCDRMGIDVWEVVDAASTKPFGFMRFEPGPGLGGHCIPIDPFYLTWKAREFGFYTEFIELAGKVNENMPYYCRSVISQALNHGSQKSLKGSKVLVLGVAYKADISDVRESPALKIIELLRNAGADVSYHDPHVPEVPELGLTSMPLEPGGLRLRHDRHGPLGDRLRRPRRPRAARRRLPERNRGEGSELRQGLEALKLGQVGLGPWGRNVARNFGELAELVWLCDAKAEHARARRRAASGRALDGVVRRPAGGRERRGGRDRNRRAAALPPCQARARGGQARVRREATGDARLRDGRTRGALRGSRPRAHAGPFAPLSPRRAGAEAARRLRRAR